MKPFLPSHIHPFSSAVFLFAATSCRARTLSMFHASNTHNDIPYAHNNISYYFWTLLFNLALGLAEIVAGRIFIYLPTCVRGPVSATSHDTSHCFEPRPICNGPSPWFRCGAIRDTTRKWRYCQRTHTERSTLCLCPVFPLHLNFKLI